MSFLKGLFHLFEKVIFWCLGFLIAGCIFFVAVFYVAPVTTGIPLDFDKYIVQTQQRIHEKAPYTVITTVPETNETPLIESIIQEIDKSADNLIKWINQ